MLLEGNEIQELERKYRLNLINSLTGVKPANLIGTRSEDGLDNLAIFSSVVHLGSNPAQLGMISRPQGDVPKDTYANLLETGVYTINQVSASFIKNAHYTSAKLPRQASEFDRMNLEREFIADFHAPFVKESQVKMGMKHLQNIDLPNGCILIIGEVQLIQCPDDVVNEKGQLQLDQYDAAGIGGLNTYYSLKHLDTFPYVRENEIPDFNG